MVMSLTITSCRKDIIDDETPLSEFKKVADYDNEVVHEWNETYLQVERYGEGYRPGPAPRSVAYLGLSAYEACVSGMPEFNSFNGYWVGFDVPAADKNREYHWPTVINSSYEYLMPRFFPNVPDLEKQRIRNTAKRFHERFKSEIPQDVYDRSVLRGRDVAEITWEWSKTDIVGHDHYLDPFQGYSWVQHFTKPGDWQPTFPGPGQAMGGVWGQARTFFVRDELRLCRKPLPYSEDPRSQLYAQALEVYSLNTPVLSFENKWVGEFWSDDLVNLTFSPGVRFLAIGNQVLKLEKSNLETAVWMTALVGTACNDAGVVCWNSKYHYNFERPVTYIQRVIDENWGTNLNNPITNENGLTPSFPAYPSGHSTMGAAGAEALGHIFGYSYAMTDNCHKNRTEFYGMPRSFSSFEEMAAENAWSRVPLGVHFRMDSEEGVRFGKEVGRSVHNARWKK